MTVEMAMATVMAMLEQTQWAMSVTKISGEEGSEALRRLDSAPVRPSMSGRRRRSQPAVVRVKAVPGDDQGQEEDREEEAPSAAVYGFGGGHPPSSSIKHRAKLRPGHLSVPALSSVSKLAPSPLIVFP